VHRRLSQRLQSSGSPDPFDGSTEPSLH
jgi:hypothetical protein